MNRGLTMIQRVLLAVILIEVPFQVDIYLDYQEQLDAVGAVQGLNVSITTLCLCLLYVMWLPRILVTAGIYPSRLVRLTWPPIVFLAIVSVSAVVAWDRKLAIYELFLLTQAFLLYLYLINWIRTREDVRFVVGMLLIGLALESTVMIGLRVIGHSIRLGPVFARIDPSLRVGGTVGSPNTAGAFVATLLAPALALVLAESSPRGLKRLATLAVVLSLVALTFTMSRGAWIAAAVSLSSLFFLMWYGGYVSRRAALSLTVPVLLLAVLLEGTVSRRLMGDDAGAAYSRIPLIQLALRVITDYPVLGIGANNFAVVGHDYAALSTFRGIWFHQVHNKYILVWVETGTLGLAAFLWFLLSTLRRGWNCWRLDDPLLSPLALGFAAGIVGHMVHMLVDIFHGRPLVQLLWIVAGLTVAISQVAQDRFAVGPVCDLPAGEDSKPRQSIRGRFPTCLTYD